MQGRSRPAATICGMRSKLKAILTRIAFCVCGAVTVSVWRVSTMLEKFDPNNHFYWFWFRVILLTLGGITVCLSLLPMTWSRQSHALHDPHSFNVPLLTLLIFAAFGYLAVIGIDLFPTSAAPSMKMVYSLCPACVATATVDPSLSAVLLVLAPMNAAVFGAFGVVIGTCVRLCRR